MKRNLRKRIQVERNLAGFNAVDREEDLFLLDLFAEMDEEDAFLREMHDRMDAKRRDEEEPFGDLECADLTPILKTRSIRKPEPHRPSPVRRRNRVA